MRTRVFLLLITTIGLAFILIYSSKISSSPEMSSSTDDLASTKQTQGNQKAENSNENLEKSGSNEPTRLITSPLDNHSSRINKKPFGIKISPQDSPVQPERFSGYHTGTDFEVSSEELEEELEVRSICKGKVIQKKFVSGYGGVIIQECEIESTQVTVLYGHISLSNSPVSIGETLDIGEKMTTLGRHLSSETDGERKHLHLGIHKGNEINLRGYVNNKSDLDNWINIEDYL